MEVVGLCRTPAGAVSLPCRDWGEAARCRPVAATTCLHPRRRQLACGAVPTALPLGCPGPLDFAVSLPVTSSGQLIHFPGSVATAPRQLPIPALTPSELEVTPVSLGGSEAPAEGSTPQLDTAAPLTPLPATLSSPGSAESHGGCLFLSQPHIQALSKS